MHITKLGLYPEARKLCEGKRYARKGRRIDNYTVLRLQNAGTDMEHIIIGNRRWVSKEEQAFKDPVSEIARFWPDNRIECERIRHFSAHQLNTLFSVWGDRDRHNYKVLKDCEGKMVMYGEPVTLEMCGTGFRARIKSGTPVPSLRKDDDASSEWARTKRAFDRTFKVALKVGAFVDIYHNQDVGRWAERQLRTPEQFIEYVKSNDHEGMVRFMTAWIYKHDTPEETCERMLDEYRAYYIRNRRDILIAVGARVDAN